MRQAGQSGRVGFAAIKDVAIDRKQGFGVCGVAVENPVLKGERADPLQRREVAFDIAIVPIDVLPRPVGEQLIQVVQRPDGMDAGFEQLARRLERHAHQAGGGRGIGGIDLDQAVQVHQHPQHLRIADFAQAAQDRRGAAKPGDKLDRQEDRVGFAVRRRQAVLREHLCRLRGAADEAVVDQLLDGALAARLADAGIFLDRLGRPFGQLVVGAGACRQHQEGGDEVQRVGCFQRPELRPDGAVDCEEQAAARFRRGG